jgi:uncharacterized integral membrane protein
MTLTESLLWSLIRCVLVASISLGPVAILTRQIECSTTARSRRIWLFLAVLPFFVPELLIGFNYRLTATQLSQGTSGLFAAVSTEFLYLMLLVARSTAFGVAVRQMVTSSSVSKESLHAWNSLKPSISSRQTGSPTMSQWRQGWLMLHLTGPWRSSLIAWSIMALTSFQEVETAALMQIDRYPITWSVWLFDAHANRQPLSDSIRMILGPLTIELMLLSPALWMLFRHAPKAAVQSFATYSESPWLPAYRLLSLLCLFPGLVLFLAWPLSVNLRSALSGLRALLQNSGLLQMAAEQILTSTGFAVAAAILAINLSGVMQPALERPDISSSDPRVVRKVLLLLLIPGLMGSLVLSLLLVATFQHSLLRPLYDTWLPMLLGQSLAILPRAFALVVIMNQMTERSAFHSASLLRNSPQFEIRQRASSIVWRMSTFRWLLCGLVIAQWCFWDVTTTSILRPVQLEPVVTRLYNEMHYGRTESLMSLTVLSLLTPFALWGLLSIATWLKAVVRPTASDRQLQQ